MPKQPAPARFPPIGEIAVDGDRGERTPLRGRPRPAPACSCRRPRGLRRAAGALQPADPRAHPPHAGPRGAQRGGVGRLPAGRDPRGARGERRRPAGGRGGVPALGHSDRAQRHPRRGAPHPRALAGVRLAPARHRDSTRRLRRRTESDGCAARRRPSAASPRSTAPCSSSWTSTGSRWRRSHGASRAAPTPCACCASAPSCASASSSERAEADSEAPGSPRGPPRSSVALAAGSAPRLERAPVRQVREGLAQRLPLRLAERELAAQPARLPPRRLVRALLLACRAHRAR